MGACCGGASRNAGGKVEPANDHGNYCTLANPETDRELRAAAAERRALEQANKGVQPGKGQLAKKLENERKYVPPKQFQSSNAEPTMKWTMDV